MKQQENIFRTASLLAKFISTFGSEQSCTNKCS